MKFFPIILSCLSIFSPINEEKAGNLIETDKISTVKICSEGKLCHENIEIVISTGEEKIIIEPNVNIGYNPQIFIADFCNNGLEELMYSISNNDGNNFYQIFSFKDGKTNCLFDSENFNPTIEVSYLDNNIIEINFQGKKLFLSNPSSEYCNHDDCQLQISEIKYISPYYSTLTNKCYLQIMQSVYGGYSANCFGYISSLIEIKEDGFNIVNVGTSSEAF